MILKDFKFTILHTWHEVLVGFSNCSSWSPIRFDSASLYARKNTDLEKQNMLNMTTQTKIKNDFETNILHSASRQM